MKNTSPKAVKNGLPEVPFGIPMTDQRKASGSIIGSGVQHIIPKGVAGEPVDHVEFTFKVCNGY